MEDISRGITRGVNGAEILRQLKKKYVDSGDLIEEELPDVRTIQRYAKAYSDKNPTPDPLDEPFQWHNLSKYGVPWEASSFLMSVLSECIQAAAKMAEDYDKHRSFPTFRDAIWWWRIHLACPEIEDLVDLQWLANTFVVRELVHQVLGRPLVMEDLEVCLALKPWMDETHHRIYHDAVDAGIVPGMLSQDGLESGEGRGCTELLLSQRTFE
jgi:hypothetical protein